MFLLCFWKASAWPGSSDLCVFVYVCEFKYELNQFDNTTIQFSPWQCYIFKWGRRTKGWVCNGNQLFDEKLLSGFDHLRSKLHNTSIQYRSRCWPSQFPTSSVTIIIHSSERVTHYCPIFHLSIWNHIFYIGEDLKICDCVLAFELFHIWVHRGCPTSQLGEVHVMDHTVTDISLSDTHCRPFTLTLQVGRDRGVSVGLSVSHCLSPSVTPFGFSL